VSTLSVPRVASASARSEARRTDPRSVLVKAVTSLPSLVPAVAALLFTQRDAPAPLAAILPLAALLIVIVCVVSYVTWRRTIYRVGAEDIRIESGIVSRAARSVPFERIQDVNLEQAFLPRLFGLVEVRFDTGAGAKDEVKLTYLTQAEGARLRDLVRERRAESDASLPADGEVLDAGERVLFAMTLRRVLTLGLFQFSLIVVGVAAGAVQQFDFLLPFDPYDLEEWQRRLAGPGAWLAGLGAGAQAVGAALALLSLGLVGVISGVGRTALKEWNFTLTRNPKGSAAAAGC
jgi:putative membrane protein